MGYQFYTCFFLNIKLDYFDQTLLQIHYGIYFFSLVKIGLIDLIYSLEDDDTLWPPLTEGKGRKEKKKKSCKNVYKLNNQS